VSEADFIAYYRRSHRRTIILAIASLSLSIGLSIAFYFSAPRPAVIASAHNIPTELTSAFVQIARQVEPAVVNISTVTQPASRSDRSSDGIFDRSENERVRRGNGSGVIVDASGFILTNHHVIYGVDRLKVKLFDATEYPARVVGSDPETDLAVIKIEPRSALIAAKLGDSDRAQVGDWVLAIGSPFGLDQTVTAGIISARDREATEIKNRPSYQNFLQTDAAINRGNSGGPLINLSGEVIGINTAMATSTGDYNGIGFALPSNEALGIYQQLNRRGRVVRGFLGVITDPVTPQIAKVYGLKSARGAIVSIVTDTYELNGAETPTPAARAGLQLGDVILDYRGEPLRHSLDLIRRVAASPVGSEIEMKIIRQGQEMKLRATIGQRPSSGRDIAIKDEILDRRREVQALGLDVANISIAESREYARNGIKGILITKVDPGSIADDAELRADDVIELVNRAPVSTAIQFRRICDRIGAGEPVVLQVYRRRSTAPRRFVSFNMP
jgi:serine protease Do